jgi:hypothetical protein
MSHPSKRVTGNSVIAEPAGKALAQLLAIDLLLNKE